ncbi:hypothetical protein TrST_g13717 [Triparma strigata]|uniref:Uncharacterized protein n=1 Tax=Triparma strigata TaxID=1606541 RepID=A0A9W7EVB7_9STRA|nr:hypothetical protein TrST_g13717 [Triparma strigata]
MFSRKACFLAVCIVLAVATTNAFSVPSGSLKISSMRVTQSTRSATELYGMMDDIKSAGAKEIAKPDRQWNFNGGRSPWGLKNNAEIWNGRVAQMAFVWVLLQEAIFHKGVVQGFEDGDFGALVGAGAFGVCVLALTGWLALKGDESDISF